MPFLIEHCPTNPTLQYALDLLSKVPTGTTEIIAKGGGSTLDVGKWIAGELGIPCTCIPTTAGTGSEVTKYCVLTVDGKKKTFSNDKYLPKKYVLDPSLVTTLPYLHTLASGLDALSQCFESYWSKNATKESDTYAKIGLELIPTALVASLNEPLDLNARMNMLIGAHYSGRSINITKTNVCHAISYPLTDLYGIPHGIACAMSLGYFAEKFLNIPEMKLFLKALELPKYEFDKEKVVAIASQSEKLLDCPFEVTKDDILASLL